MPSSLNIRFKLSPWEGVEWVDKQTWAGREGGILLLSTGPNKHHLSSKNQNVGWEFLPKSSNISNFLGLEDYHSNIGYIVLAIYLTVVSNPSKRVLRVRFCWLFVVSGLVTTIACWSLSKYLHQFFNNYYLHRRPKLKTLPVICNGIGNLL